MQFELRMADHVTCITGFLFFQNEGLHDREKSGIEDYSTL